MRQFPENAFVIKQVRINDLEVAINKTSPDENREYIEFSTADIANLDGSKIRFLYEVKQSMAYGFVSAHIKKLTRDASFTYNYSQANDIEHVWTSTGLLAERQVREINDGPKSVVVKADGWILPKGAIMFTWTFKN